MKIKVINEINDSRATIKVNEFLDSISEKYEVVEIKYRTPATQHTAWNCIVIIYKEKK